MATEQELAGKSPLERALATLFGQSYGTGLGATPIGRLIGIGNPPPSAPTPNIPTGGGAIPPMPPIGDPGMPTPRDMSLGPALSQIEGGASSPLPTGTAPPAPPVSSQGDVRVESMMGGATELPTGATQYPNGAVGYEIQPGDSLSLIGAMFGVTYDELIAANEDLLGTQGKSTVIHPGQKLVIPSRSGAEGVADMGVPTPGR